ARKHDLRRFYTKLAVAVVTEPSPPACHDSDSGWRSHRCCGGLGGDGGVWMVRAVVGLWRCGGGCGVRVVEMAAVMVTVGGGAGCGWFIGGGEGGVRYSGEGKWPERVAGGSGCCHGSSGCHDRDGRRCMAEGDVVNLVDRDTRSHFGACWKISPEKLSGGGGGDDRRWPAAAAGIVGERCGKRRPGALIILFVPISLTMVKDDILERIHVLSHYGHRISAH
nr:hypothetical protein [Tanacetum cinerariifolium]